MKQVLVSHRTDEVYVKSRESQKNDKNSEVVTITSVCLCVHK